MSAPLLVMLLAATPASPQDPVIRQLVETRNFRNGTPTAIQMDPRGRYVLFLRSPGTSTVQSLQVFDVASGQSRELLSADVLLQGTTQQLTDAERAQLERRRVSARGFLRFSLAEDGRSLITALSGKLYRVDVEALLAGRSAEQSVRQLSPTDALDPTLSRDGKKLSYVKDWDLHVLDLASGKERRLTTGGSERLTHGLAEFVAEEEMDRHSGAWWSPDGSKLLYEESDTRAVETFTLGDPAHPERPFQQRAYPRVGKNNAKVRLGLVSSSGGKTTWVRWDADRYPYVTEVQWPGKGALTLYVMDRPQQHAVLLAVDPKTGATRTLLEEQDPAWVSLAWVGGRRGDPLPLWLPDGSGFFWVTQRHGGNEAELRGADGTLKASWIKPDQKMFTLSGYDATERALYWIASPEQPDLVAMRTREDGTSERLVAGLPERVEQTLKLSSDGSTRIVGTETPTALPTWAVYGRDGRKGELPLTRAAPLRMPAPEYRKLGPQGFWSYVLRPRDAKPGQKLPTVVYTYGGPFPVVRSSGADLVKNQWLADQGFLVVAFDNRGTVRRDHDWERATRKDPIGVIIGDQAAALQLLAREVPELDLQRVGIHGWSYGGYTSAAALLTRPEVYKAAVSGAPVTDWRNYDTFYTERFLGLADEPGDVYQKASLLPKAAGLKGALLLVHGTTDDNVFVLHSLQLSDALFRAGRAHEFLPLSGFTHMVADPVIQESLSRRTADFFREHLVPETPRPATAVTGGGPAKPPAH